MINVIEACVKMFLTSSISLIGVLRSSDKDFEISSKNHHFIFPNEQSHARQFGLSREDLRTLHV